MSALEDIEYTIQAICQACELDFHTAGGMDILHVIGLQDATIATQAAEIEQLTAALKPFADFARIWDEQPRDFPRPGDSYYRYSAKRKGQFVDFVLDVNDFLRAAALLRPQAQPAQAEPETPTLSRYAADIVALADGKISEREFYERQGRRPV